MGPTCCERLTGGKRVTAGRGLSLRPPMLRGHGLRQFENAVEPQELQHSLDRRPDIAQDHFGAVGWKVAVNPQQKSDARAVDELDVPEFHLRAFDPRIDPAFKMVLDGGGGAGVEAGEVHSDVENFARDICLEFISHMIATLPRAKDYAMRNPTCETYRRRIMRALRDPGASGVAITGRLNAKRDSHTHAQYAKQVS